MTKDFYSFGAISFKREHIIFIIEHLEDMKEGRYPPDYKVTGYTGKKKSGISKQAYFENPCILVAEVECRLKFTGRDGESLIAEIQSGETVHEKLSPESQLVLDYISLWDFRKRPKYSSWKRERKQKG